MSAHNNNSNQPQDQSDRFASNFKGTESNEVLVAEIWNISNVKPGYMLPKEQTAADAKLASLLNLWRIRTGGTLQTALAYYKKVYNTPRH